MCGRFVRVTPIPIVARHFRAEEVHADPGPGYNIAPSQEIVIINNEGKKQLVPCRWGFVPSWARDLSVGDRMINARAETVAVKRSFRNAFKERRCLVAADGFYEWRKEGKRKYPVYIRLKSGEVFGFAGLYSFWTSPKGERVCTCTIITTEANEVLKPIHDRMPVIIPGDREDLWLDPLTDKEVLQSLLTPYDAGEMEAYDVSPKMNSPQYDSPENILPL
jgi:putative SOS response-associated peptidase YedK